MRDTTRQSYASIRRNELPRTPVAVLHIGEDRTGVASGMDVEPNQVLILEMGTRRTSTDFFKHNPPSPLEIETAIMVVEDEVTRARGAALGGAALCSADELVGEMVRLAGGPDALMGNPDP